MEGRVRRKVDVSLLRNEDLRPWTVNPNLDERLKSEKDSLERTITYIAPNMSAGKLGSSVLDGDVPGVREFRSSLSMNALPLLTKLAPMNEFLPLYVTKSNLNSRALLTSSKNVVGGNSRQSLKPPPSSLNSGARYVLDSSCQPNDTSNAMNLASTWPGPMEDTHDFASKSSMFGIDSLVNSDDMKRVDSLHKAVLKQSRINRNRAATGIHTVKFNRSISPATISMRYREYQRLRNELDEKSK